MKIECICTFSLEGTIKALNSAKDELERICRDYREKYEDAQRAADENPGDEEAKSVLWYAKEDYHRTCSLINEITEQITIINSVESIKGIIH